MKNPTETTTGKKEPKTKGTKSARYSLYFEPGLYDQLKDLSFLSGITINELINQAIIFYFNEKKDVLIKARQMLELRRELTGELTEELKGDK